MTVLCTSHCVNPYTVPPIYNVKVTAYSGARYYEKGSVLLPLRGPIRCLIHITTMDNDIYLIK